MDADTSEPRPGERVIAADDRLTMFPDREALFVEDQPWLGRLLQPLYSIQLSAIDPAWSGQVPMLSPVEPESGLVGEESQEFWDEFGCANWLAFRVEDDGRLRFLGDRRLFAWELAEQADSQPVAGLVEHYKQAEAEFAGAKVRWDTLGALVYGDKNDPTKQAEGWGTDIAIVDQLGGDPGYGNWTAFSPPPHFTLDMSGEVVPVLRLSDGRPLTFVAETAGYPWRRYAADAIVVFYEPETATVVYTFDYS